MIAYVSGDLTFVSPTTVYIETNGVAYDINISLNTFSKIENLKKVRLWTHLNIKDDGHTLYGFFDKDEKSVFRHLISVSGVGPNTARVILSSLEPHDVKNAILNDGSIVFSKVKGIGPKTAKRIILDLKDKIAKEGFEAVSLDPGTSSNSVQKEAEAALLSLGFQKAQAEKSVKQYFNPGMSVEELIKIVLKQISK